MSIPVLVVESEQLLEVFDLALSLVMVALESGKTGVGQPSTLSMHSFGPALLPFHLWLPKSWQVGITCC